MTQSQQKILMCAPDYFGVEYVINPWMEAGLGKSDGKLALQQWQSLRRSLESQTDLVFVAPQKGFPDMVFTANAGMVLGNKVIVSRFHSDHRTGEEVFFKEWFEKNGFEILPWPQDVAFEGAGDALLDRGQNFIWVGYGFRTDAAAPLLIEKFFGRRAVALHLIDPRFYHLDTCLCPLPGGYVMYYPAAFDAASQKIIAELVPEDKRIIVNEDDALKFCCNAVDIGGYIFLNAASTDLQDTLRQCGFMPFTLSLSEFMKSGGSAKCLTLKLVEA